MWVARPSFAGFSGSDSGFNLLFLIHMQHIVIGRMILYFLLARRQKQTGDGHAASSRSSSIEFINKKYWHVLCFVLYFLYPSHIRKPEIMEAPRAFWKMTSRPVSLHAVQIPYATFIYSHAFLFQSLFFWGDRHRQTDRGRCNFKGVEITATTPSPRRNRPLTRPKPTAVHTADWAIPDTCYNLPQTITKQYLM